MGTGGFHRDRGFKRDWRPYECSQDVSVVIRGEDFT